MADQQDTCGISFLIHGPSKAGKSFLGDSAPAPRLFLDAEGNTRFLRSKKIKWDPTQAKPPEYDGSWETCIVRIRDFATLSYAYQWLASGQHPFRSIIIDSISETQQRCIDAIAGTDPMKMQDWGELLRKMSAEVRKYRDLLDHPTNPVDTVIFTAMSKQAQDGKSYPFVQGQLATSLPYYIDVIGYLSAQITEEGNFTNYLLTKPHPLYEAGDRVGIYDRVITNPRIDTMFNQFCNPNQNEVTE
jgi:hypothetical protein